MHTSRLHCRWRLIPLWAALAAPAWAIGNEFQNLDLEFDRARPEVARLNRLLDAELARLLSGSTKSPSPLLMRLMNRPPAAHPALGDTTVPLHLRLIERQRQIVVASARWAGAVQGHCDPPDFSPAELMDPHFRAHLESVIDCRRRDLDRFQAGIHDLNEARERTVLELKLPAEAQPRLLAQAHANTLQQDAAVAADYGAKRALLRSIEDLARFLDVHEARLENDQFVFGSGAEIEAARNLIGRLIAAAKAYP